MKNSPDDTPTISAVDHRSTMRNSLDEGILQRQRRRVTIQTAIASLEDELQMLQDSDDVALAAITALEERMAGVRPAPKGVE